MDRSVCCKFQWSAIYSLAARSYPELEYCPLVYDVHFLRCDSPESLICCASDLLSIPYYDIEMVFAGQIILRYNIRGTMLPEHLSQGWLDFGGHLVFDSFRL